MPPRLETQQFSLEGSVSLSALRREAEEDLTFSFVPQPLSLTSAGPTLPASWQHAACIALCVTIEWQGWLRLSTSFFLSYRMNIVISPWIIDFYLEVGEMLQLYKRNNDTESELVRTEFSWKQQKNPKCQLLKENGRFRGMGRGGRWEGGSGWGTHLNPWLTHVNVW